MGWLAGDAFASNPADAQLQSAEIAFWEMINSSYTQEEVGIAVGYTFSYLSGFLISDRTKAMMSVGGKPADQQTDPTRAPAVIYGGLTGRPALSSVQANVFSLATNFFSFVVKEFYAISGTDIIRAAKYQSFIIGFQQGLMLGADALFLRFYSDGYILGYTDGFRDGYSQGYIAGWTAGYSSGYQAGQSTWMSGLQSINGGLSGLLNDAQTLGKLLSEAATVDTVIAGFSNFGLLCKYIITLD